MRYNDTRILSKGIIMPVIVNIIIFIIAILIAKKQMVKILNKLSDK